MITVIGSVNLDYLVTTERFAQPGETLTGISMKTGLGGKGANQAIAAARAGAKVRFVGAVGRDAAGDASVGDLKNEGIDVAEVLRVVTTPTGTAIVIVDGDGENMIYVLPGANYALTSILVNSRWFSDSGLVVLQGELQPDTTVELLRSAAAAGCRTILNLAPPVRLEPDVLAHADILIVNASEASFLLGTTVEAVLQEPSLAADALGNSVATAILTLGARGVAWRTPNRHGFTPAHLVSAVDTTGAGDSFTGNLAAALWRGDSIPKAITWASAAAALTVKVPGAATAMPLSEATVEQLHRHRASIP